MANANWTIDIYGASEDQGTPPYDTVGTTTLLTYSGYTTKQGYILAPQRKWAWERFDIETMEGWKTSRSIRRKVWDVEFYPATWAAGGDQDLEDIDDLAAVLDMDYVWIRIETPDRNYPSTASAAHPVIVTDWQEGVNKNAGLRSLTVSFEHKRTE